MKYVLYKKSRFFSLFAEEGGETDVYVGYSVVDFEDKTIHKDKSIHVAVNKLWIRPKFKVLRKVQHSFLIDTELYLSAK